MPATISDAPAPTDLGARFSHVRLLRRGARFLVYEAYDDESGRWVSAKTCEPGAAQWIADQLLDEARLIVALGEHPYLVTLHETAMLDDGRPVLLFEHCTSTLDELVHPGAMTRRDTEIAVPRAVDIGIKIASALEALHKHGVAHCDLRPSTVVVTDSGEPAVGGLGEHVALNSAYGYPPLHLTTSHTAPELLEGEPPTPATDVYGLGSTLYELIAGRAAFRAYAGESAASVIVRVLSNPVRPIVMPGVPLEISDLLTWAMNADPAKRPPTPAWVAEEFGRIQTRLGWDRTALSGRHRSYPT